MDVPAHAVHVRHAVDELGLQLRKFVLNVEDLAILLTVQQLDLGLQCLAAVSDVQQDIISLLQIQEHAALTTQQCNLWVTFTERNYVKCERAM